MNLLQIHVAGVSSCDIPIKVLESVDHGEYRVFLSKFWYIVHSDFCIVPPGVRGQFQSKVIGMFVVFFRV